MESSSVSEPNDTHTQGQKHYLICMFLWFTLNDVLDIMMDMDDDHLADDFSKEGRLDLAMLPPCENADTRSDQDSNSSNDIK